MDLKRALAFSMLAGALAACGGSVSGNVVARQSETTRELAGTELYLVAASVENVTALGKACVAARDWYDRYRDERARLIATQRAHGDSASWNDGRRSERTRGNHLRLAALYQDSLSLLPSPPDDSVDSVATRMSSATAAIDDRGHYSTPRVRSGKYFVVLPGLGWAGADVHQWGVRLDLPLVKLQPACVAVGPQLDR
jgi:hypothetical protein